MTVVMSGGKRKKVIVVRQSGGPRRVLRPSYAEDLVARVDEIDGHKLVLVGRDGSVRRGALVEDLGPRKKQSKLLRPLEKRLRKSLRRQLRTISAYLVLHERANHKKKNGWIRDLPRNLSKARRKRSWE